MTSARHKPFAMVPPSEAGLGEPVSTPPDHALVAGSIHLT